MKKPSFEKYVNKQDRINESVEPVRNPAFNLEMTENLNEWSWPFSRADTHKESNKTKQTETDLKNLFAYFKAVNYKKHPKLEGPAKTWMAATKSVLAAIDAERKSFNANAKTQVVSGPTATPTSTPTAPKNSPLLGRPLAAGQTSMLSGRQQK